MSEKNYVVNVKNKNGTIVTFRADTATELNQTISDFIEAGMEFGVANVESLLLGTATSAPSAVDVVAEAFNARVIHPTTFAPVAPPAGVATQSAGAGTSSRNCMHGEMTKRTGDGQWGPYKAYYCPTPKGTPDQCKPIYVKPNDPDFATF